MNARRVGASAAAFSKPWKRGEVRRPSLGTPAARCAAGVRRRAAIRAEETVP